MNGGYDASIRGPQRHRPRGRPREKRREDVPLPGRSRSVDGLDEIELKSEREIAIMREAGLIVAEAHQLARTLMKPGVTTLEVDGEIDAFIRQRGGTPTFLGQYGFPKNVCISINDQVVHGIPGPRKLEEGDLVSIDIGCTKRGFIGDSAWTYPVGEVSQKARDLLAIGEETLMTGLRQIRHGADLREVGRAIQQYAEGAGYGVVRDYTGHGVGRELHEPPQVPNYVDEKSKSIILKTGMTLAIEPMVNEGTERVRRMRDKWTVVTHDRKLSVHFEHTVAVQPTGALILTARRGEERALINESPETEREHG
jgi:methionyl aminopeptidase